MWQWFHRYLQRVPHRQRSSTLCIKSHPERLSVPASRISRHSSRLCWDTSLSVRRIPACIPSGRFQHYPNRGIYAMYLQTGRNVTTVLVRRLCWWYLPLRRLHWYPFRHLSNRSGYVRLFHLSMLSGLRLILSHHRSIRGQSRAHRHRPTGERSSGNCGRNIPQNASVFSPYPSYRCLRCGRALSSHGGYSCSNSIQYCLLCRE